MQRRLRKATLVRLAALDELWESARVVSRTAKVGRALVVNLAIVGCAGRATAPIQAPSASSASAPVATVTPAPLPEGWTVRSIPQPPLRVAIPPEWQETSVAASRETIAAEVPPPDLRAIWTAVRDLMDSGRVRFIATGPSTVRPWTASVMVIMDAGDASLDAAVARIEREPWMAVQHVTRDEAAVTLPIGSGRRVVVTTNVEGAEPSRAIMYVVLLGDGSTLSLIGSNREEDRSFLDLMRVMAESLSR